MSRLPFDDEKRSTTAPRMAAPERRILTVSELSTALRNEIESRFHSVWVEGEVSNVRRWNTGHVYFTLKDNSAQIKGVMFRSTLRTLRFKPEDGLRVVARGRVSVYEPKGEYQLVCEHMEPQGHGPLQLAFDQLKKKLTAEGLFEVGRKRPLPALPRRIGIVTSLDGAALRDIVRVLRRRYPNAHLVIGPTRVQGDGAAADIASAINVVSRVDRVDVLILARGGGSLEDLWAFNEEVVAHSIARAAVPVICGVGHDTDVTIADFVADLRAPTPSAAAELVVRRKDEFFAHIDRLGQRLHSAAQRGVLERRSRLQALEARPGYAGQPRRLAWRARHVLELTSTLRSAIAETISRPVRRHDRLRRSLDEFDPRHRLAALRTSLVARDGRMASAASQRLHRAQTRFRASAVALEGLSPLAVLGRGYAVCWDGSRTRIIRDAATVHVGDPVRVTLEKGELDAMVTRTSTRS
ncbi:MAG: exodeoxyribonuclease VII large subunit [Vicinamibacterales bacterium]